MKASSLCIAALALGLCAGAAHAAPNPFGLNLAWDACHGDGGVSNRLFACNTNSGAQRLHLSFKLDQPLVNVNAVEMYLQIASESATLPAWWSLKNVGTCRPTALTFSTQPDPAWTQCVAWDASFGVSGIGNYVIGGAGLNSATTVAVAAVPAGLGLSLTPGVEYFTGSYVISNAKTVGTGACGGCLTPMCVFYAKLRILTEDPGVYRWITTSANTPNSQGVTWQSAQFVNLVHNCDTAGFCTTAFGCGTPPVPAHMHNWGAVKSLYR